MPQGELLEADARLIVTPDAGVFEPVEGFDSGARIVPGQTVGHVTSGPHRVAVVSPFGGSTGDMLAWRGERLVAHQPVMWLSVPGGSS